MIVNRIFTNQIVAFLCVKYNKINNNFIINKLHLIGFKISQQY